MPIDDMYRGMYSGNMTTSPTTTEKTTNTLRRATERIAELDNERTKHTAARREAVSKLRAQGWTFQRIANEIGLSKAAVAQIQRGSR
jgi:DNA-binding NarL/FixJ family response regulator